MTNEMEDNRLTEATDMSRNELRVWAGEQASKQRFIAATAELVIMLPTPGGDETVDEALEDLQDQLEMGLQAVGTSVEEKFADRLPGVSFEVRC